MNDNQIKEKFQRLHDSLLGNAAFLDDQLRLAGLYLILFEHLKDTMKHSIEMIYGDFFQENGDGTCRLVEKPILPDEIHTRFFKKNGFQNQLDYFLDVGAIDENDIEVAQTCRAFRNEVAHRLIRSLTDDKVMAVDMLFIKAMLAVSHRIDNWYIRNFEIDFQPKEIQRELDEDSLGQASSIATQMLVHFVNAIEEKLNNKPQYPL